MEDGDDDFGDLYADVEVEASSAMNVAPQISQLQFVSDETGKPTSALETSSDKEDRVSDGDEDDDDDDDLNIVLNSDDDSIRHGEGLTIARTNKNLRNGELEDEDDDNFGTEESPGGKAVGNSHSLYKYSRSQSASYQSELKGNTCGPQHGQRFSLPWCRSILDVNINVFEQKPWKHPEADVTDYFNFGLNEDSWKLYCKQVDEYRHRGPMSSESPVSVSVSDSTQLMETRDQEVLGRAIEVEDSIVERQSSMDVMHQMERDTDVIQITIMDPDENSCGPAKEESGNHESSVAEEVSGDDDETDHLSFSSESEDESFEETKISALKRSSNRRSSSISENHEIHQISDEAIKTSERTGENTCTTDPYIFHSESSEAKKSPKSHCKSFKDRWKSSSHERCSFTELTQSGYHHSDDHRRYHSRNLDVKRKHVDHTYHSPPVYNNRIHRDSKYKPKFHHENDDIIFSRNGYEKRKHGGYRYHERRHDNQRSYERIHPFDPYNEENILYSKELEPDLDYYHGERFSCYEDYERFGSETGRPVFRSLEEEEYYGEQRRYNDDFRREYFDDIKGEKFRSFGYNEREKYEFEDEYVKHVEYTRWEFKGPVRNKKEVVSPFVELNNHLPKRKEFHINNGRLCNNMMPRSSLYKRERRYEGKLSERFEYFEPFDGEDYTIDYNDRVNMARFEYFEPFEESIDDPYVKGRKCNFERISDVKDFRGNKDSDIMNGGSYEWVFKGGVDSFDSCVVDGCDDLNKDGCGYKRKRQVISGKKCRKNYGESGKKVSLDSRLVVRERKFFKKQNKAAQAIEPKAIDDRLDIEEGQILTEELKTGPTKDGNTLHNQNGKTGVDKSRILEARVKMEKRRAHFNTTTKMESDSTTTKVTVVDSVQKTGSNKSQRPTRKRRWGEGT